MPFFFYIIIPVAAAFAILNVIYGPRRAWQIWQRFGHMLGDLLARVVLTVFYFTVFIPFALVARLTQDPLGLKAADGPLWPPVAGAAGERGAVGERGGAGDTDAAEVQGARDLDAARRQF